MCCDVFTSLFVSAPFFTSFIRCLFHRQFPLVNLQPLLHKVAAACLRKGITVAPYSFTGPGIADKEVQVSDGEGKALTMTHSVDCEQLVP
jgi:hypothetical protein